MAGKKLHLIFDHSHPPSGADPERTVLIHESGEESLHPGISWREFYGSDYEQIGYDFCRWWYRLLSQPNHEGKCLHDLVRWDGQSALWWSHLPFLYPDFGIFPRALCALQAVNLFRRNEISEAIIQGSEVPLVNTLCANQLPSRMEPQPIAKPASKQIGIWKKIQSINHWYFLSRWWRYRLKKNHRPRQAGCLLYSIWMNEWQLPGDGSHRYLEDTLTEVLENQLFDTVRPLVYSAPLLQDPSAWQAFLKHSLMARQGVYGMAWLDPRQIGKVRRWARQVEGQVEAWMEKCSLSYFEFKSVQLGPLFRASLQQAIRALPVLVLRYEALKKCMQVIQPGALLLKDEVYPDGRLLVSAARAAGVRSVSLQHGTIYPSHWCYIMDSEASGNSQPPLPDVFGVYGASTARLLVERGGFPQVVLRIVGARRFRHLSACRPNHELEAIRQGKPLVLIAGQMHQDMGRIYEWCLRLAGEMEEAFFIFKPHPRDQQRITVLEEKCAGLSNTRVFKGPLGEVLPFASVTLSGHSTVLLESIWMQVPALSIQISGEKPADWQLQAGILDVVHSYAELERSTQAILKGELFCEEDYKKAQRYLEDFLGFDACQSSKALLNLFHREE